MRSLLPVICAVALLLPAATKALEGDEAAGAMAPDAVTLGADLDGDGDPDEITIRLEVIEVQEEVYPGKFVTFWVFAPEGRGMVPVARVPSPTIRVEEGDRVRIALHNTHYFPHTIHLHGTIHPNAMDGVPDITQAAVNPGEAFVYEFIAKNPGTHFYHCHVQPDVHVLMGLVGMLIIEPNRPDNHFSHLVPGAGRIPDLAKAAIERYQVYNHFSHLVPGAGRIPDLAKAAIERYQREYSLVYLDIDDRLNRIPAAYEDPREIEKRMHRDYDSSAAPAEHLPAQWPVVSLHPARHAGGGGAGRAGEAACPQRRRARHAAAHPRPSSGSDRCRPSARPCPKPRARVLTRDVFSVGAAQRVDLELRTGSDAKHASGPGV